MVSEPRRSSYAAALSGAGEVNQGAQNVTPITSIVRSPARTTVESIPQMNQTQRNVNTKELDNPMFIGFNDNPSAALVSSPLLGSSNYGTRSISMRIALEIKNKLSFIDGSVVAPNRDNTRYSAWRRCNLMICSWLFKFVHPSIAQSIMHFDQSRDIWEDLRRRFAQCDAQRISILQSEIYNQKQGLLSVGEHFEASPDL